MSTTDTATPEVWSRIDRVGEQDLEHAEAGDRRFWSVTSIIDVIDKKALTYWSANQAAEAAIDKAATWQQILATDGRDEAIRYIANERFRTPNGQRSAADLGTAFHACAEEWVLTGRRPELGAKVGAHVVDAELVPFLDQFDAWLDRMQPTYLAAEVQVYNVTYGYAGTADTFLAIDGVPLIVDYKTSRKSFTKKGAPTKPYPEQVGLQLPAYAHAEIAAVWKARRYEVFRRRYYLLNEAERALGVTLPEVAGGLVVHVTPDHCEGYPIQTGPAQFEAFLHTMEVARWVNQESHMVMGEPLRRPVGEQ